MLETLIDGVTNLIGGTTPRSFETPEVEIVDVKELDLKEPLVISGFVGAGLVGSIAIDHIISSRWKR